MSNDGVLVVASSVIGAIVGSFLNVVIFRMPRGLSISAPRWSFCPHCQAQIKLRDNIPVLGWLLLRGRCRSCAMPIGIVYPVVEASTALLFLLLADALFIGKTLPAIGDARADWPIAIAYFVLFACLLATAGMDVESYMVDVRVLYFGMLIGVMSTAAWFAMRQDLWSFSATPSGPASSIALISASSAANPTHAQGILPPTFALIGTGMGLTWWVSSLTARRLGNWRMADRVAESAPQQPALEDTVPQSPSYLNTSEQRFQPWPIVFLVLVIIGLTAWLLVSPLRGLDLAVDAVTQRGIVATFVFMVLLVLASVVHRESDHQIMEEIEAERSGARRVALREAASFIPAMVFGLVLFGYWRTIGKLDSDWSSLLSGIPPKEPVVGATIGLITSVGALVWCAAIGWFVRIAGTLGFGKEAYGTGDIYIMAAIGAVMGVWGLVFTFFLAALLAILGVIATMFWKSSRAIPFGPWLAMGAFATLWLFKPLLTLFGPTGDILWSLLTGRV